MLNNQLTLKLTAVAGGSGEGDDVKMQLQEDDEEEEKEEEQEDETIIEYSSGVLQQLDKLDLKMEVVQRTGSPSEDHSQKVSIALELEAVKEKGASKQDEDAKDGSDTSENMSSKGSSDLTPSDQRSNEEAGSSLKESDNASSSGSSKDNKEGSSSSGGEMDQEDYGDMSSSHPPASSRRTKKWFSQLFVPLKVKYDHRSKPQSPWLSDANFSKEVNFYF